MKKKVNWQSFIDKENYRQGTHSQEIYDKEVEKLVDAGILSYSPENNFVLMGCGVVVSPCSSHLWKPVLYFTRKKDAIKYAELEYGNAQYNVFVEKIEKVV